MANIMNMAFMAARETVIAGRGPQSPDQRASINAAPLFPVGGIASIVGGAMSGMKLVLMRKWAAGEAMALAEQEEVTSFGGVPAMAREVLEYPGIERLAARVRSFPMGGASVPPELPRRAADVFGDSLQLLNGYGLTETWSRTSAWSTWSTRTVSAA